VNAQTLKSQVRQYVMDNFLMGSGPELGDDDSFMGSHVLDSVGVLELISFLEQTFGIKVKDEEMLPENLDSLTSIGRYLERKLAGAAAENRNARAA
jgi:acyl carrier protein